MCTMAREIVDLSIDIMKSSTKEKKKNQRDGVAMVIIPMWPKSPRNRRVYRDYFSETLHLLVNDWIFTKQTHTIR